MQVPASLRPFAFVGRIFMWVGIVLFLGVGLFHNSPAWAETTACPGQSSIPITPISLFLRYGGSPATYQVSLCENPAQPVNIVTSAAPAGEITILPASFTLTNTVAQTVSVGIVAGHPIDEPFTVVITHTPSSNDPEFNSSLNVSNVTAYYLPPIAVDDSTSALPRQSRIIDVLDNDIDASGQGLTLTASAIVTQPVGGVASLTVSQTVQYTSTAGFSGLDTFTYRVEDGIGNTDVATVTVNVAAAGVENPQIEEVDPIAGGQVEFESALGVVAVTLPSLAGFPPGSTASITFGEVLTPTGDVDSAPLPGGNYSGVSFVFSLYINGELVQPGQLDEPLVISFPISSDFINDLDGERIFVAVWDGTNFITEGVQVVLLPEPLAQASSGPDAVNAATLEVHTTVFGEFSVFTVRVLLLPTLANDE